jgi:hypothetical protein
MMLRLAGDYDSNSVRAQFGGALRSDSPPGAMASASAYSRGMGTALPAIIEAVAALWVHSYLIYTSAHRSPGGHVEVIRSAMTPSVIRTAPEKASRFTS